MKIFNIHKAIKKAGLLIYLDGDRIRIENPELLDKRLKSLIISHHFAVVNRLTKGMQKVPDKGGELLDRRKVERIDSVDKKPDKPIF